MENSNILSLELSIYCIFEGKETILERDQRIWGNKIKQGNTSPELSSFCQHTGTCVCLCPQPAISEELCFFYRDSC